MVKALVLILSLAFSFDFPTEHRAEKFNACYYLTRLKLSLEKYKIDSILGENIDVDKVGNKLSSDLILKCYKTIDYDLSIEILQQGEEIEYLEEYEVLVGIDFESLSTDTFELTEEHYALFEEVKKIKLEAEEAADEPPVPQPPLPPVGIWYVFIVIIVFSGLIYWGSSKVLSKPQNKIRKKNKKNS